MSRVTSLAFSSALALSLLNCDEQTSDPSPKDSAADDRVVDAAASRSDETPSTTDEPIVDAGANTETAATSFGPDASGDASTATDCEFGRRQYLLRRYDEQRNCFEELTRHDACASRAHPADPEGESFCSDLIGYALDPEGDCWQLSDLCLPGDWEDITFAPDGAHVCLEVAGMEGEYCPGRAETLPVVDAG